MYIYLRLIMVLLNETNAKEAGLDAIVLELINIETLTSIIYK
jgi:hypothetical protein